MFFNDIHKRIRLVFVLVIAGFLAIIIKIFYIQVFEYNKLSSLASDLWSRNLPIKADRGIIYDRNSLELATNITTTSLVIIPSQIKNVEEVTNNLSKILNVSYDEIKKHVTKKTSIERVHPEGRRLDYETADKISSLNMDGVYLVKESKRYYPYDDYLAHSLGYVGIDNQGLSGLELMYEDYLTGSDGAIKYYSDGHGDRLDVSEVYVKPQKGININLTIDLNIQKSVERELDNIMYKYNADKALIIAMNPNTGEILALGSRPSFDANNYKEYSTEVINRNLPIWMTYEPGSTFKIITLSASINEESINIFKDTYNDSGSINVEGTTLHCWKHGGHGLQTYLEVAQNSCNPGFVNLGLKLGKDTLFKYIKEFGFGSKTGVDLNGESKGILFDINKIGLLETATTAFGQGVSVTPIQQITAVSAAINGGYLYKPYIVSSFLESETNSVIKTIKPTKIKQVITEETSKLVRYTLENVVANGTGRNAYIENYRIGGKTGTAQKVDNGRYMVGNYILSFIGFMPADRPEIVLYVAIDNPKGVTQYGGTVAAPAAKNIFNDVIEILNIKESTNGIPKEYLWSDIKYIKVPNVLGMNLSEAKKISKDFKLIYSGNGNNIVYQNPSPDKYVAINSEIKVLLN